MASNNKLKQNIIYNSIYQVIILFIPIITMPYLTRVLSVEQLGINGYTLSIIQIFVLFSFFGINNYGSREIAFTKTKEERNDQFWSIWLVQIIWTCISFLVFLVLNMIVFKQYNDFLMIQSLLILINMFEVSWFFVGIEELKKVVIRNTTIKFLLTLLIFILIRDTNDFTLYIGLNVLTVLIGNITLIISLNKYISKPAIKLKKVIAHMKKSSVFLLPQLAILVYTTLDRTILGTLSDVSKVGYYEQGQKIIRVAIGLVSSVGLAIMPRMTYYVKEQDWDNFDKLFKQSISYVSVLSFYVVSLVICVAPTFVIWFFGANYKPVITLMQIIAPIGICIPIATLLWNTLLIPMKQDKIAIKSAVYAAIISVILNLISIRYLGAIGAAFTLLITEVFGVTYRWFYANKYYNLAKYKKMFKKYAILSSIVIIFVTVVTANLAPTLISTIIQGILVTGTYLLFLIITKDEVVTKFLKELKNNDKKNI